MRKMLSLVPLSLLLAPPDKGSTAQAAPTAKTPDVNPLETALVVRGFKRSKGKDVSYDEGVTTTRRLADVICELGSTGMMVSGMNVQRIKHLKDNGENKAGDVDLVMKWSNKGGPAFQPVFVTETNEAEANKESFTLKVITAFDAWYAAQAATVSVGGNKVATGSSSVKGNSDLYA